MRLITKINRKIIKILLLLQFKVNQWVKKPKIRKLRKNKVLRNNKMKITICNRIIVQIQIVNNKIKIGNLILKVHLNKKNHSNKKWNRIKIMIQKWSSMGSPRVPLLLNKLLSTAMMKKSCSSNIQLSSSGEILNWLITQLITLISPNHLRRNLGLTMVCSG